MTRGLRQLLFGLMAAWFVSAPGTAEAQYAGHPRPTANAVKISSLEAPTIDGNLGDPIWAKADAFDEFYQVQPDNGSQATERTVVRVLYDENNLYVGIYAYDRQPDQIIARRLTRDNGTSSDDYIKINIDPGLTRRDAYDFEINPIGGRTDALLQNNNGHLTTWDTIWGVKTSIVSDGWILEATIPFRELSFDPAKGDWGFDIVRGIKRKGEVVRWGPAPANTNLNDVSWAGTLTGFSGLSQGIGLDIWAYGLLGAKRYYNGQRDEPLTPFGGNAYYKITPGLTGTLTFNTDFSDALLDARQVNTTRFSLFTDETRQFFLQDAAAFEFGGRNFINTDNPGSNNGRPFFSRNIGLVNGAPVRLIGGAKLSGNYDDLSIGALVVRTGSGAGAEGQTLSVLRLSEPIFGESRIGMIATNGDPSGLSRNTLLGGDFQFQDSNFYGKNRLIADLAYQRSFSSKVGDDDAYTASVVYPNEPLGGQIFYKQIGANFAPVLGFANRTGIRDVHGSAFYRERYPAKEYLRYWELDVADQHIMDLNNHLESSADSAQFVLHDRDDDQISFQLANTFEDDPTTFKVAGKVPVPGGQYSWNNFTFNLNTSGARSWDVAASVECCSFYNGDYLRTSLALNWRPSANLSLNVSHALQLIRLPSGDIDIHIFTLEPIYNFNTEMQLHAQFQYDNISKRFSMLLHYLWEYEPGQTLFASVGEESIIDDQLHHIAYTGRTTQALIRLGHTFQF